MQEDELDRKIEAALATYADPEANVNPSALAARVLASAGEKQQGSQWWRWGLAAIVPALAALLMVLYFPAKPKMEPVRPPGMTTPAAEKPMTLHPAIKVRYVPQAAKPSRQPPKLDVFPTPTPLTRQEKLFLAFVQNNSPEAQQQVAQGSGPIQPITIAALIIPPLEKESSKTGDRK